MTLGYSLIKKTIIVSLFSIISLSAFSQTIFVRTTGNDLDDGLTALTAKATINAAITAASVGSTIDIGPGNFAENVIINKNGITLQGAGSGANGNLSPTAPDALNHTIISGGGVGRGVQVSGARTNVTVKDLAIVGYTAEGFYAPANSNNLTIENLQVNGNCTDATSRGGIFVGGNISDVIITGCAVQNNGPGQQARGIGIWDNFKQNITITNNYVVFIACCGIDLNDGTSSGVNISNNTVIAGAAGSDSGIGVLGMTSGAGPNIIANNSVTVAKRYGIEIKNPAGTGSEVETEDGAIVVRDNSITRVDNAPAVLGAEARDLAGIAVFRRSFTPGNPAGYIDVPGGVVIKNNTIQGFSQINGAGTSEGFGIVAEGVRILIKDNNVINCEVGIQRQSGNPSNYVKNNSGDADQAGATNHFNRGNSPFSSGIVLQNNFLALNSTAGTRDFFTGSTFLGETNYVYNTRQRLNYASITLAIETAIAGDTLMVGPGEYNELVNIDKSLTIIGESNTTSIINYTAAVPGGTTPSLFKVSATDVTIQDLGFTVNLTNLHSAIHTSGITSNLKVLNNKIVATRSAAAGGPSYGTRNAIVINKNYTAAGYTFINTGWVGVEVRNNIVEGTTAAQNTFADAFFRSAVDMDLTGTAVIDDNEFTSVNHDVTYRFGNQGKVSITNNLFHGGGVEISEMNAGADSTFLIGNTFTSTFGALSAPTTAQIRIKNCDANQNVIVKDNNVSGKYWLMSIENSMNVIVDNNTFTGANINTVVYPALAGINPKLVTVNTKTIASSTVANNAIGTVFTNNTFNLGTATNATALGFYNHKTPANYGTFVLGTNGNENNFGAGFDNFIYIDNNNGNLTKDGANVALAGYPEYGGSIAQSTTGYWTLDLEATQNFFDVGAGLVKADAMNAAERTALETKLYHKVDDANIGLLTTFYPIYNLTTNSGYADIQSAIDAAVAGDTLNMLPETFTLSATVNINKALTIIGNSNLAIKPIVNGTGSAATQALFSVTSPNVTIQNIEFEVSQTGNTLYGIRTGNSGTFTNLRIEDNLIEGTNAAFQFGTYGIHVGDQAGVPSDSIFIINNTITSNPTGGFGRAIRLWNAHGEITGNTLAAFYALQSGNAKGGNLKVNNNIGLTGQISFVAFGAGNHEFRNNTISTGGAVLAPNYLQLLEVRSNENASANLLIEGNTFNDYQNYAVFIQRSSNITISNNIFNPLANSTGFVSLGWNSKSGTTGVEASITSNNFVVTGNTFNGSGAAGGVGVQFANHNSGANPILTGITLGGAGALENSFNASHAKYIQIDGYTGNSQANVLWGAGLPATTGAVFAVDMDASLNLFDGLLPSVMTDAQLYSLEDKIDHATDIEGAGLVSVKANNIYVTQNSFVTPYTTNERIQRAVMKAVDGNNINIQSSLTSYDRLVSVDKDLTIVSDGAVIIDSLSMTLAGKTLTQGISNFTVNAYLNFNGGKIELGNNNLNVAAAANVGSGSATSYVLTNGTGKFVRKGVDDLAKLFPVGTATSYAPVTFDDANNTGDDISVSVQEAATLANFTPTLVNVTDFVKLQWNVNEAVIGGTNASLTFNWNVADESTPAEFSAATLSIVSRYDGANWVQTPGTIAANTATASGFTSFSPFAVSPVVCDSATYTVLYVKASWANQANVDANAGYVAGTLPAVPAGLTYGCNAHATINAALAKLNPGGVIYVYDGTYNEDVVFNSAGSSLRGPRSSTTPATIIGQIGGDNATVRAGANNVTIDGFTITRFGNTVVDWNNAGLNSAGIAIQTISGATVQYNIIEGNRTGIDINNTQNNTILRNKIDFNRTGILERNNCDGTVISENEITNNWTSGFTSLGNSGGGLSQTLRIINNNISGNWFAQVEDRAVASSRIIDLSSNWFGSNIIDVQAVAGGEPGYTTQIPVAYGGAAVPSPTPKMLCGVGVANLDYTPWLNSGTDVDVASFGFQRDTTYLNIDNSSPQFGLVNRLNEAVSMIQENGTINFASANYTDDVTINKSLIFTNSGATTIGDLTMNGAGKELTLNSPFSADALIMTDGIINTTSVNTLTANSATTGNTNSFINGPLNINITNGLAQTINFPIGKTANGFRGAVFTGDLTANQVLTGEYFANGANNTLTIASPILNTWDAAANGYWNISSTNATAVANGIISFNYDANDVPPIGAGSTYIIAKTSPAVATEWISIKDNAVTFIPASPGVVSSDIAFNSFSSFALAPASQCADASMSVITPTCLEDSTVFSNLTSAVSSIVVDRYEWNFGDGSPVFVQNGPFADPLATNNPTAPKHVYPAAGNYTAVLTVVTTSNCSTTDTVELTIIDAPAITVTNPNITICDNSAATVNFNVANIGSITPWTLTYKINSAGLNQVVNGNGPGAFSFTTVSLATGDSVLLVSLVNNTTGCSDLSLPSINVNYTPVPQAVNFTTTTIDLCDGSALILSVPNAGVDTTYTWSGPNGYSASGSSITFPNATALTHNGNYTVIASYLGCNGAVSNAITVTVDTPPTTNAGNDITICEGQSAVLAASSSATASWSYVSGPSDLTNLFGTATPSLTEAISATATVGTHQILLTSTNGVCQTTDDLIITINPALAVPTIAAVDATICVGENLELSVSNAQMGATYTWTAPDGASFTGSSISRASATLAMSGNYSVNVMLNGCSENSAPFAVTINAIPVSNAGASVTTCFGTASAMNGTASTGTDLWTIVSGPTGVTIAQLLADPSLANSAVLATAPSGNYVLQLTSTENGCTSNSTTNLTINAIPVVAISGASSVCENGSATFNIFVSGLNTSDNWTINYTVNGNAAVLNGTGSGTFSINPTFTLPGATQIVDLVSISNDATTCTNNTLPEASISVIANPTSVNFTTTTIGLCEGSDLVLSVPSPQAGVTYTWSGPNGYSAIGSTVVYANATAATHNGVYNVTPNNGSCVGTVSNNITVTIDAVPTASAGTDLLVCEGQTASLSANSSSAIFTWTYISGPSSINNLFGTPTPTLVQSLVATATAGTHVIRLTSINGVCQVTDDVTITINPALTVPVIVASSPSVCEGSNLILSVNNVVSGATYTWTSPDGGIFTGSTLTRANATVAMTGNYTVQVLFNGCVENSAAFPATVNPIPVANAGSNVTVCFGVAGAMAGTSSTGVDTWSIVSGPAGVTIGQVLATAGSATSAILATAPVGNYVLSLSSTVNGCTGTDNTNLTINENPNATVTGPAAVCDGSSATFNINVSGVGINTPWTLNYTVNGNALVLNGNGSGNFTVNPIFNLPGANQIVDLVSLTNNTTTCVNSSLGQTTINVIALPTAVNFTTTSVAICDGENLQLSIPNPISGATYTWSGPSGFSASGSVVNYPNATTASHNGNYSVVVSQNGCTSAVSNNITVTVNPIPTVNAGNNQDICYGFGGVISPVSSGGTAQWSVVSSTTAATIGQILSNPNNLVSAISTNAPTGFHILRVSVTNNGCSSFDDIELTINDIPTATLVGPTEVCDGSTANVIITVSGITSTQGWTLNYTVNGTAAVLNGVGSGNFNISPTLSLPGANQVIDLVSITNDATTCNSNTLPEITISVLSIPTLSISISSNGPACEKQMVDIYANLLGGIAQSYNWILNGNSTGYNSPTLTLNGLNAGDIIYLESVVDGGCAGIQTLTSDTITVNPIPTVDAGDDKVIIEGDSVMLSATSTGAIKYLWTPSNGISNDTLLTPKASPKMSIDYIITATNEFGCSVSDVVRVDVMNAPDLTYNSFTPDGDGVNDTWIIENMDQYPNAKVSVFNRWGVSVFESTGYLKPWDGTNFLNGEALPVGSYYYVIDLGLGLDLKKGVINIIK